MRSSAASEASASMTDTFKAPDLQWSRSQFGASGDLSEGERSCVAKDIFLPLFLIGMLMLILTSAMVVGLLLLLCAGRLPCG